LSRLWLIDRLDLRGLPGPGGVKMVTALAEGNTGRDWATYLVAWALPLRGGDIVQTMQATMVLGCVLAVIGIIFASMALLGGPPKTTNATQYPWGIVVAAMVAITWSQGVFVSFLYGADAIGWGLAWFGLGLTWISPQLGKRGLFLAILGSAVTVLGVAAKESALPVLPMLLIAPILGPANNKPNSRPWIWPIVLAAVIATTTWFVHSRLLPHGTAHAGMPDISLETITNGASSLHQLLMDNPEGSAVQLLAICAVFGALWPGQRWMQRVVLGVLSVLVCSLISEAVGSKLRVRHLLVAMFPVVVLAGASIGAVSRLLGRIPLAGRPLQGVPSLVLLAWLCCDTLAFVHQWAQFRSQEEGAIQANLPTPPDHFTDHYKSLKRLVFNDTSTIGGIELFELSAQAPKGGITTVPLRDAREFHLQASAALQGAAYAILDGRRCCAGNPDPTCARQVTQSIANAGGRLVLPKPDESLSAGQARARQRVENPQVEWARSLRTEADQLTSVNEGERWLWWDFPPSKETAKLPCGRSAPQHR